MVIVVGKDMDGNVIDSDPMTVTEGDVEPPGRECVNVWPAVIIVVRDDTIGSAIVSDPMTVPVEPTGQVADGPVDISVEPPNVVDTLVEGIFVVPLVPIVGICVSEVPWVLSGRVVGELPAPSPGEVFVVLSVPAVGLYVSEPP